MLRNYETMFIVRPGLDEENYAQIVDKFKGIIEKDGGEVTSVDEWGKRRLAYEIDDFQEGYYVVMNFKANASVPQELERVFKISDEILRYIIIRDENKAV